MRVLFCLLLISSPCMAQDVGFSQFYDQPFLRNPALAGVFDGDLRVTASYRNQWESVTVPYRTFGLSTEYRTPWHLGVENSSITAGMQILRDVAGDAQFSTTQLLPSGNFSFPLGDVYISLGGMIGFMQQRFDPTKLVLNDQFVENSNGTFSVVPGSQQGFNKTSVNYIDGSAGLSFSGSINEKIDYYAGLACFHLNSPKVGFYDNSYIVLNKKVALNLGLSAPTNSTDRLIFYADYFQQFVTILPPKPVHISTTQFGLLYNWGFMGDEGVANNFTFGALYRMNDAIIPVLKFQLNRFILGMSYDVNVDKLAVAARRRGGFEMVLTYRGPFNRRRENLIQTKCPSFRQ